MVIENKGGGATNIGTDAVAKADPDGYTVLLQSVPLGVNRFLMNALPFDPVADLAPVTLICDYPNVMAVPVTSPAHSVKEFIAYAKANPGKVTAATQGTGSTSHLTSEWFQLVAGVKFVSVPYRGSAPALQDLVAGNVDLFFDNLGVSLPLARDGKIKLLAVGTDKRMASAPSVPALIETLPDFVSSSWVGVFLPPKTPQAIADKLIVNAEELLGRKVYLGLFVKVVPDWTDDPRKVRELAMEASS